MTIQPNQKVRLRCRMYLGPAGQSWVERGSIGVVKKVGPLGAVVDFDGCALSFSTLPESPVVGGLGDLELVGAECTP